MNNKERIHAKAQAKLARMRPNTGHARILRAKLGITDAPVVEPVVEEPVVEEKKPRKKRTKKSSDQ
jgi:hypothetical protein